jgi:multicomponent Na+:H+ antiporter subunit B
MKTIIFTTAIRILTPLFLLFSFYILFRGHNHPGGGFIGGLIGSITFVFHVLAHGSQRTARQYFSIRLYRYKRYENHNRMDNLRRFINANVFDRSNKNGSQEAQNYFLFRIKPSLVMGSGLLMAAGSGMIGLFYGEPFMTGYWLDVKILFIGSLGTPFLFDFGVYQLVLGMVLKMIFTMSRE